MDKELQQSLDRIDQAIAMLQLNRETHAVLQNDVMRVRQALTPKDKKND